MGRYVSFSNPPVIEVVLGLQFEALPLSSVHSGWFWRECLGEEWPIVQSAPRLPPVLERFAGEQNWIRPGIHVSAEMNPTNVRHQFTRADRSRMIQFQDSRLILNWQGKASGEAVAYPSFDVLLPQFVDALEAFQNFLGTAGLPALTLTQWEVVYVNMLHHGDLWRSMEDWPSVLRNFCPPHGGVLDSFDGKWVTLIENDRGKLHTNIAHVRTEERDEALKIELTARGPIDNVADVESCFELGHKSIVLAFAEMTTDRCHKVWGREK